MVDVEGNGQQPPDLVEISIVPIQNGTIGQPKNWLVRPPRPITAMARHFHRITDDEVADAPTAVRSPIASREPDDGLYLQDPQITL
ncbi:MULTISPECIES: exonuclease domain-containing protein [Kribbella]|uniref:3'-5' exonuclease n=1 Tax=Kribbella TaxID=182639 RepID=UPI0013050F28|nr:MULTISPECIES: exonuclease domain-containing protein [Kribbella]